MLINQGATVTAFQRPVFQVQSSQPIWREQPNPLPPLALCPATVLSFKPENRSLQPEACQTDCKSEGPAQSTDILTRRSAEPPPAASSDLAPCEQTPCHAEQAGKQHIHQQHHVKAALVETRTAPHSSSKRQWGEDDGAGLQRSRLGNHGHRSDDHPVSKRGLRSGKAKSSEGSWSNVFTEQGRLQPPGTFQLREACREVLMKPCPMWRNTLFSPQVPELWVTRGVKDLSTWHVLNFPRMQS